MLPSACVCLLDTLQLPTCAHLIRHYLFRLDHLSSINPAAFLLLPGHCLGYCIHQLPSRLFVLPRVINHHLPRLPRLPSQVIVLAGWPTCPPPCLLHSPSSLPWFIKSILCNSLHYSLSDSSCSPTFSARSPSFDVMSQYIRTNMRMGQDRVSAYLMYPAQGNICFTLVSPKFLIVMSSESGVRPCEMRSGT